MLYVRDAKRARVPGFQCPLTLWCRWVSGWLNWLPDRIRFRPARLRLLQPQRLRRHALHLLHHQNLHRHSNLLLRLHLRRHHHRPHLEVKFVISELFYFILFLLLVGNYVIPRVSLTAVPLAASTGALLTKELMIELLMWLGTRVQPCCKNVWQQQENKDIHHQWDYCATCRIGFSSGTFSLAWHYYHVCSKSDGATSTHTIYPWNPPLFTEGNFLFK